MEEDKELEHVAKKMKTTEEAAQEQQPKADPDTMNIDTVTISRICARCRIDFVDERNLRSHFLKFRNQASFGCELCHKSYVRGDILQEHQRVHMNENLYKCVKCFYSCNQIYDIYEHMHTVHKVNIDCIFKCPYDDIVFRDKDTLFQHVSCHRIIDKNMRVDYSFLEKPFEVKPTKEKAIKEENTSEDETGVDDILPSTLLECNLDANVLGVHKQADNVAESVEVEKPTETESEDKGKVVENEFVDEVLDEIDKSTLIDVDYVKNDMVINTENYSNANTENDSSLRMLCFFKNIKCAYCTKVYIMKNDLKNHLVEDHDLSKNFMNDVEEVNKEQFECFLCNIKFDFAIDLTHHNTKEHTKYECEICNKVYHQAYNLKKHMKTCTPATEKEPKTGRGIAIIGPIVCALCEKVFKRNWNLKQHMQNIHKVSKT